MPFFLVACLRLNWIASYFLAGMGGMKIRESPKESTRTGYHSKILPWLLFLFSLACFFFPVSCSSNRLLSELVQPG